MVGEFGSFTPDYRSWSQREYGLRVGIFRVIDALKTAGIRPVIAANAMALDRLPGLVRLFQDWGCDWLAHGLAATRMMHSGMPLDEQRQHIAASIAALAHATGVQPLGWLSQDWGTTPDTPQLLADAGIRYTLDWCNDDQPYALTTTPSLLSVPLSAEWDDVQCQWLRQVSPRDHADLAVAAFDRLHRECAMHQRSAVFGLGLHPWLSGMPSRIAALRRLLARLRAYPDVHWTTPGALLQHVPETTRHGLP
jgi:peptidoglycan/xylan/chitin deacetylase (PgdA/CDA1 family)